MTPNALLEALTPEGEPLWVTPFIGAVTATFTYNGVGSATVPVPASLPKIADVMRYGALLRLHFLHFPPFPGTLEEVSGSQGELSLSLRSAEALLQGKTARQTLVLGAGNPVSAGEVAFEVFRSGVLSNSTVPLQAGTFDAPRGHFVEYNYPDVFETFSKLAEEDGAAFWVDEEFRTHFRQQRGLDKSASLALYEGVHLTNLRVSRNSSSAVSHIVARGSKDSSGYVPVKTLYLPSAAKLNRSKVVDFSGITIAENLVGPATEYLRQNAAPVVKVEATVVDVGNIWGRFWLGDIVTLVTGVLPGYEEHRCRIDGIEVSDGRAARLVLTVVPEASTEQPLEWRLA